MSLLSWISRAVSASCSWQTRETIFNSGRGTAKIKKKSDQAVGKSRENNFVNGDPDACLGNGILRLDILTTLKVETTHSTQSLLLVKMMLMCIPLSQTTMSSQEALPTPFNRSFTVQEFDRLLTSALDIDRVPLPLINFAPSRSSPASLEWTADLDSYVDDQHDIDALEKPFLNLDGLSVDLGKPPSPPTLLRKVKSRAIALVRRGRDDSYLSPVTEIDFEDFVDEPSPPVRVRTKSLPLPVFNSRKSKDLSSVEPRVRRPCRSFIEDSVPQHPSWRRSLALHSPSISFGPRPTPRLSEYECPLFHIPRSQ